MKEEAKELIETGTLKQIQAAIDNHNLRVNDNVQIKSKFGMIIELPCICYAMMVGRPDVLELLLKNHAKTNIAIGNIFKVTPLRFVVGAYSFLHFSENALPENLNFKNLDKYAAEYIPLLLKYGAKVGSIELFATIMEAMGNPNPVVLNTLVREVKRRPLMRILLKKFLKIESKAERIAGDNFPDDPETKKEYEITKKLRDALKTKKPKKEALKAAGKGVQNKINKVIGKTTLYTKKQKTK